MKRKPYTVQEKEELLKSEAIEKVNDYQVTYSNKFKVFAVGEYISGKTPMEIFKEIGINVNILGRKQPQKSLTRWRKIHDLYGVEGLLQERRGIGSKGRPRKIPLSTEEQLLKLQKENEILKEQVSYLKKLRGWE